MSETHCKRNMRIEDCGKDERSETLDSIKVKKEELKAKRDALESTLSSKLAELRALCLREGELTGELPPETPLGQREPVPQIRKRVRTESTTTSTSSVRSVTPIQTPAPTPTPTPTTSTVPSRASNHSSSSSTLSHSSVTSNTSTFSNVTQTSSLPSRKIWIETSIDDSPQVSRKKKLVADKIRVDCSVQTSKSCDEIDSRCAPVVVKPLPQPLPQPAPQPLQVHVQQQVQLPVKPQLQQLQSQAVSIIPISATLPQSRPVSRQSRQSSRPSSRQSSRPPSPGLEFIPEDVPLRENRRNVTTPRPVSIPLSPILPKPGSGVEVNVLSVGHYQPYWEETKPYEMSDFFKYSTKHRKKAENNDTGDSKETSRRIVETKTKTITSSSMAQVANSVPPQICSPVSPDLKQNSSGNRSSLNSTNLSDSFIVNSAVADDFHDEMYEWYETKVKKATLV